MIDLQMILKAIAGLTDVCEKMAKAIELQQHQITQLRADVERHSIRESGDGMLITH